MGILDNQKFVLMVCELFYNQDMTQKEIAAELGISRPQVCRVLAYAREAGLVKIHLEYPDPEEDLYERKIRDLYGLPEVYVYNIGLDDNPLALDMLAQRSSGLFNAYIRDNSQIGVMAGRSVQSLAKFFPSCRMKNTEFIPLCGGNNSNGCEWFANSNARACAEKTSARYYILNAPSILSSLQAKELLIREQSISRIIDLWTQCDTVLLGIGAVGMGASSSVAGFFSQEDIEELRRSGAVASIACSYLDKNGKEINHSLTERFIGAKLGQLAGAKKIAVAIGKEKVPAIQAALAGDCVDVLITSLETAKLLADE
ncbi:MAG: MarR family transcriptional regulator [Clostridia bacterium]|nr:MarR family transcriptional regulator [Clostridia bacterium]